VQALIEQLRDEATKISARG